jgi:hypothetical protein
MKKTTNPSILNHRGKIYSIAELAVAVKLTEVESRIVLARQDGCPFSDLDDDNAKTGIDQIMLHGAAICGCPLPHTEFFADIISEEIKVFINDFGYANLTLEEILLALRLNSKGGLRHPSGVEVDQVVFIGNCFHVDYLSKVLANYFAFRTNLDRKFQNYLDGY